MQDVESQIESLKKCKLNAGDLLVVKVPCDSLPHATLQEIQRTVAEWAECDMKDVLVLTKGIELGVATRPIID